MKKYILTLCVAIFSVCLNITHAQDEIPNNGDEFIDIGFPEDEIDGNPKAGDTPRNRPNCNRSRCEGYENISFSLNNTPHALRMEALVNSIQRAGIDTWMFIQETIIKNELDARNRHVSSSYEFARDEYFTNYENAIASRNIPILTSGRNRIINEGKSKRNLSLKDIKLLRARLQEIKQGNINRSLYANKTYNNRPMSFYKTENSINSVLNTANESFYANEVKINEDLLIRDQLSKMINSIRAVNQLGVTDNISKVLRNRQIGHFNNFKNRWKQIILMQRYLSNLNKGNNSGNIWPIEFGTKNYLLAYAKEHRKKDIDFFHKDYWKVILKRDFGNNFIKSRDAINKYIRLRDAELNRLLNTASINVNSSVDFLVSELTITNSNQLKWLNNNPSKAKEMESVLKLTKLNPNPNTYNSSKKNTKIRILENGTVEEMITKLKLESYRKYLYDDEEMAYNLRVFSYRNSPGGRIKATALSFIKEALEAVKNNSEANVDFDDQIINELTGKALCVYNNLKNLNLFKSTIGKFNSRRQVYNLTLKFDPIKCRGTDVACTSPEDLKNGNITIYLREIETKNLDVAATILHEGIHAEIYRFVDRKKKGLDPNDRANLMFWYKHFKALNGKDPATTKAQHEHMADRFVIPIAKAIRSLDKNRFSLDHYMAYGWEGLRAFGYNKYLNKDGEFVYLNSKEYKEFVKKKVLVNSTTNFNNQCK